MKKIIIFIVIAYLLIGAFFAFQVNNGNPGLYDFIAILFLWPLLFIWPVT